MARSVRVLNRTRSMELKSAIRRNKNIAYIKEKLLTFSNVLGENTDEFCKSTTLHGLKYLVNRSLNFMERIFFFIAIAAVILLAGFFIRKVYDKWDTTPVILAINPDPTFIRNEPFPAVTICNLNQALKSKTLIFPNYSVEFAMLQLLCKRTVNATIADTITDWNNLDKFIISQTCENMLVNCRFGAKEYDCNQLFRPIVTDGGLCCAFNLLHPKFMFSNHIPLTYRNTSEAKIYSPVNWNAERGYPKGLPEKFYPRKTAGTGESLGLSITLDAQYDEYYCSSSSSVGFKISLHSPNESPYVRETGVLIGTGRESKVRIRPEKIETNHNLRYYDKKQRRCLFQNEDKLMYFAHYTQRNCEMECMAKMLLKYCGCISFYMPKIYENAKICSIHMEQCVERVRLRTDPNIESCQDGCFPSCFDLTYFADVFSTEILYDGFATDHNKTTNYSQKYVKNSISVVNMYFKEHTFRSMLQTEFIGISDFLSSVGGLMGLFLGFSFISIVELFYFAVIHPCFTFFQLRKSKTVVPARNQSTVVKRSKKNRLQTYIRKRFHHEATPLRASRYIRPLKPKLIHYNNTNNSNHNIQLLKTISASLEQTA